MDDLISKKGLLNKINAYVCGSQDKEFICKLIAEMPTIDAVEVVRCRDCKYFELNHWDGIIITAHEICNKCQTSPNNAYGDIKIHLLDNGELSISPDDRKKVAAEWNRRAKE